MVLCPESSETACNATIQAAKEGFIQDYVFYDTSVQYLVSKLETL